MSGNMNNLKERMIPAKDRVACSVCSRSFNLDRIKTHEKICRKSSESSRKSFDITKQRVRGTEAEKFVKKVAVREDASRSSRGNRRQSSTLTTNWRRKHEDFIDLVKEAKKKLLESKEKKTDLPYPPPIDMKDYPQCPYCSRQLNQPGSEKHIEVCAWLSCKPQIPKPEITKIICKSKISLTSDIDN